LTARFHSSDAALRAEASFEKVFKHHGLPEDIPLYTVTNAQEEIWLPRLMQDAGLVQSTSEARRLIKQQAVSLDGERIADKDHTVVPDGELLLKVGKRRFCRVCFE
jgi:tyrosyl-tRNA synthetase